MEFNTLEEAQAEIIRLNEELTARTNERDTLSQNNNNLKDDNERLRKLNQNYFNKLSQQYLPEEDKNKDGDKEVPSCVELANTIEI